MRKLATFLAVTAAAFVTPIALAAPASAEDGCAATYASQLDDTPSSTAVVITPATYTITVNGGAVVTHATKVAGYTSAFVTCTV